MRSAVSREEKLRVRVKELEALLASRGGIGVVSQPCRADGVEEPKANPIKHQGLHNKFVNDALQVPDVQVQDYLETQPLFSTHLDMSLGEIATVLLQPLFFERVFQADVGAFNVAASHWGQTQQKHHRVRAFKYNVPVPADIPAAIRSVLTLPEHGTCRALCRLKTSASEVVVTLQFITEGLPFSDSVRLQVTDAFVPVNGRGSILRRWAVVLWMKELPWAFRFLKNIIVSQVMERGRQAAEILVRHLLSDLRVLHARQAG